MSNPPYIDLRSDTVTLPTNTMRQAMATAEVGDDVFGEDPSVQHLEQAVARITGQQAGLFVASGTMGNLTALLTHCDRGDEVILGNQCHTYIYEAGGSAALGSIHSRAVPNQIDGTLALDDIEAAIRTDDVHFPRTQLICLENTHNRCGGRVLTPGYTQQVTDLAHQRQLKVHLDGARIFNAAVALHVDVHALTQMVDSVSVCLSKGLAAPVGSVLCGTEAFIARARRNRKLLGGGMRQAGVIATAGLIAVEQMTERLADDHRHAQLLARGLAQLPGISVDPSSVQTNIVYFDLCSDRLNTTQLVEGLYQRGVRILALGPHRLRAVTHFGIEAQHIKEALSALQQLL